MHEQRTTKTRKCQCMKFSRSISSCPAGARKWHISYVAMLLYNKKDFRILRKSFLDHWGSSFSLGQGCSA